MAKCNWNTPEGYPDHPCRRPVEPGHEQCIFHLSLEVKRDQPDLAEKFRREFRELCESGGWDYTGFVFPDQMDLDGWDFKAGGPSVSFQCAVFGDGADFNHAVFGDEVSFEGAVFSGAALFTEVSFDAGASFWDTTFGGKAFFVNTHFGDIASFGKARFGDGAFFRKARFGDETNFKAASFGDRTSFVDARFGEGAIFNFSSFGRVSFGGAEFKGRVEFINLKLRQRAYDFQARQGDEDQAFQGYAYSGENVEWIFEKTVFDGPALFRRTDLRPARFQQVNLANLSFLHSDISRTRFISCTWGRGYENRKFFKPLAGRGRWRRFKRPRILFDELLWRKKKLLELERAEAVEPARPPEPIDQIRPAELPDDFPPSDIEVLALQLKQALEATKDPITAGDFHFAAMEMKREQAWDQGRPGRAAALWLYKMLNGYGERYGRTLLWLLGLVLLSTAAFAACGGDVFAENKDVLTFWQRLEPALFYAVQHVFPFKLGNQFWSLAAADWPMRWLTWAETLIGTTLFAFFALALRRRFKR